MQIWNRDIDKLAPAQFVEDIAHGTGTPLARASATTLRSLEGVLVEALPQSTKGLITNIGVYHRTRRGFGLRYCPVCLLDDCSAYFRKEWRVLCITSCPRHGCRLRDSCPHCDAPVVPSRGKYLACHVCRKGLSGGPFEQAHAASIQMDGMHLRILSGSPVLVTGLVGIHPLCYFSIIYRMLLLLCCGARRERLFRVLRNQGLDLPPPVFSQPPASVRFMRVNTVHELMRGVALLLRGWPFMFVGCLAEAGIWSSWAMRDAIPAATPYALLDVIEQFLVAGPGET